ncbi:hypothetical protein QTH90_29845 [Variovorax sp. J2P1-59]|uniref:hypothetical protein n=1 Tax=Variovorax flavidus TaxID=3053501 RepID=UPI0025791C1A|nr:hypothetical protein [Variovorax sp. J2P1-59]MDM0078643.1 hypothetical protein [Variovorax sp. J2P1-59]
MNAVEVQRWNQELDALLESTGAVDRDLFLQFADAHSYDAASSVGWLEAKLNVLQSRLRSGRPLDLYSPSLESAVRAVSMEDFALWVTRHFPAASLNRPHA